MTSAQLESTVEKIQEDVAKLRDTIASELGGKDGIRDRMTALETMYSAHDKADIERHAELRQSISETKEAIRDSIKPLHAQLRMQLVVIALAFVALVVLAGRSFIFEGFGVKAGGGSTAMEIEPELGDGAEIIDLEP